MKLPYPAGWDAVVEKVVTSQPSDLISLLSSEVNATTCQDNPKSFQKALELSLREILDNYKDAIDRGDVRTALACIQAERALLAKIESEWKPLVRSLGLAGAFDVIKDRKKLIDPMGDEEFNLILGMSKRSESVV